MSQEFKKPDFKLFLFLRVFKSFEIGEHLASIKRPAANQSCRSFRFKQSVDLLNSNIIDLFDKIIIPVTHKKTAPESLAPERF